MNILYQADIGSRNIAETLTPTGDKIFYRTLSIKLNGLTSEEIDRFTAFLDSKIELHRVTASFEAIALVGHSTSIDVEAESTRSVADHLITLLGARILTCGSLRWGFVERRDVADCDGFQITIYLPTIAQPLSTIDPLGAMQNNARPTAERTEIRPTSVWGRLLTALRLRPRRYRVTINGTTYNL